MSSTYNTAGGHALSATLLSIDDLPLPYLEIDARGIIIRVNRAALALHPPENGNLVGKLAFSFLAGGDRVPSSQAFAATLESGNDQPPPVVRYLYDRSGRYSAYQLHRTLMRDAQGRPAGMHILGVNVSQATEALEETRRRNIWLESVMDSIHEAVIVTDATGLITGVNPAAEELLGFKAAELCGRIVEETIQVRNFQASDKSPITLAMGLESKHDGLCTLLDRQGSEILVRLWISPVIDKISGAVAGIVLVLYKPGAAVDVTSR